MLRAPVEMLARYELLLPALPALLPPPPRGDHFVIEYVFFFFGDHFVMEYDLGLPKLSEPPPAPGSDPNDKAFAAGAGEGAE